MYPMTSLVVCISDYSAYLDPAIVLFKLDFSEE